MTASNDNREITTENWYRDYYNQKGIYRNSLFYNPEVLFQTLAHDASVIRAIGSTDIDPSNAKVLDVGCGGGGSLINFQRLGFLPKNLWGMDIQETRIKEAILKFADINFICDDASNMKIEDKAFDIVFESTMFVQITDSDLSKKIASEMIRVTKSGGWLILSDWRYSKPFNSTYLGLSKKRMVGLFGVGNQTELYSVFNGPLVPPIGRFLSKNMPCLYFLIQRLFPFLIGEIVTVLRKNA